MHVFVSFAVEIYFTCSDDIVAEIASNKNATMTPCQKWFAFDIMFDSFTFVVRLLKIFNAQTFKNI